MMQHYLFRGKAFVVPETYDVPEGTLLKEAFCSWIKVTISPLMINEKDHLHYGQQRLYPHM